MTCKQELCTHWSGDGDVCPCAVFGMEPSTPDWVDQITETVHAANQHKALDDLLASWGVATQPAEPAGEDEPCPIADCDVDVVHGHEGYGPRYAPATQPEPPDEPPGPFTDEAIRAHSRSQLEHLRAVAYMIDPSAGRVSDSKEDDTDGR